MSDDPPKFMKPGDDPVLDRALEELRFDSGLYKPGEYDLFGRRRALGQKHDPKTPPPAEEPPAPVATPAATPAPAVAVAKPQRLKLWVAAAAVLAALVPVLVYALVWKPPVATAPAANPSVTPAPAESTAAPAPPRATASAATPQTAPDAGGAPEAPATSNPMVVPPAPDGTHKRAPKLHGALDDPYGDAGVTAPSKAAALPATAAPAAPAAPAPPPEAPAPTQKPPAHTTNPFAGQPGY
jgi:hypothetical protein